MEGFVSCSPKSSSKLECDIGNPLPANKTLKFPVVFSPIKNLTSVSDFNFTVVVNSTNPENSTTLLDNIRTIHIPLRVEVNVTVHGIPDPSEIYFNITEIEDVDIVTEKDIGPEVTHVYEIVNRGPSIVNKAEIYLIWPTHSIHNDPLLYLMKKPQISGNVRCDRIPQKAINPLKILTEKEYSKETSPNSINKKDSKKAKKRSADEEEFYQELTCGDLPTCLIHRCEASDLHARDKIVVTVKARVWKKTIAKMALEKFQISSKLVTRVTALPYGVKPTYIPPIIYYVKTDVVSDHEAFGPKGVAWWIILLAVCGGLLLLALLALLLWKLGFFKRKRPQDEQPLTNRGDRNGYRPVHGDEAL